MKASQEFNWNLYSLEELEEIQNSINSALSGERAKQKAEEIKKKSFEAIEHDKKIFEMFFDNVVLLTPPDDEEWELKGSKGNVEFYLTFYLTSYGIRYPYLEFQTQNFSERYLFDGSQSQISIGELTGERLANVLKQFQDLMVKYVNDCQSAELTIRDMLWQHALMMERK